MNYDTHRSEFEEDIPKHFKKSKKQKKPYGIEWYNSWFENWYPWKWYPTEKQRDQALIDLETHRPNLELKGAERQFRKIDKDM